MLQSRPVLFALLAGSAIVPSLLLIWFFHARDVFPEPGKVLWATFGLGVLTIPGVLLLVLPLELVVEFEQLDNPYASGLGQAFFEAAIPEELLKFAVVYLYCYRHREFDEPMDGIVYGATASLGFATLENVLYVASGGWGTAILRALTAVPGHAFLGAIMGYYVGQAKFRPQERGKLLGLALLVPIVLHGMYDFPLMAVSKMADAEGEPSDAQIAIGLLLILVALATLIVEAVWAIRASNRLRREQLVLKASQQAAASAFGGAVAGAQAFAGAAAGAVVGAALPAGGPALSVPAVAVAQGESEHRSSAVWGWLMLVPGVLLASVGGLFSLGFVLGFTLGEVQSDEVVPLVMAAIVIGLLPLVLGVVLFAFGVRALNRSILVSATS